MYMGLQFPYEYISDGNVVSHLAWELVEARGGVMKVLFAAVAFLVTFAGIVGVAWSGHMERVAFHRDDQMETLLESQPSFAGWLHLKRPSTAAERLKLEAKYNMMPGAGADPSTSFSAGVFSAVFAGAVCAFAKMPETQVPASEQGLAYLPSFAIAVMINTSIMTGLPYLTTPLEWPDFATYSAAGLGILSGILWNIGNMLSIVAVSFIGRDIAYSMYVYSSLAALALKHVLLTTIASAFCFSTMFQLNVNGRDKIQDLPIVSKV
jgi:hypothetical protein